MIKKILKLLTKPVLMEQAGKSNVENCLAVVVLSVAMVRIIFIHNLSHGSWWDTSLYCIAI